jgi:hypothetical protein
VLAVLIVYADGSKEFVDGVHVHGFRDGQLQLADGDPGAGLDAHVVREIDLRTVKFVETVSTVDDEEDAGVGPDWSVGSP